MSKLFKTTLVAAAIAGMASVANAGTLATTVVNYSAQGAAAATATAATAVTFNHTVNAGFAVNDLITYTLPAGSFNKTGANWPSTITFAADTTSGQEGMTATLLSTITDESAATYRVTAVTTNVTSGTTIGATATGISVSLLNSAFVSDISVSVASVLSNGVTPIDAGTAAVKLVDSKDQLGNIDVTTKLNATVSVAKARKAFTASELTDTLTWTAANDATLTDSVTVASSVITLAGDFDGFVKGNFTTGSTSTVALATDSQSVSFTYSGVVTTDTVTITPPVTDTTAKTTAVVLEAQDFTVSGTSTFGTTTESLSSKAAGSWSLDGAVVTVPYMPYGANVSQILYATNAGSLDADVSVTAFDDSGTAYDLGIVGNVAGGSILKLAGLVKDGLTAAGFAGSGKVSLTITVNAEDKDVSIYSAYNVGGSDRGNVLNSQYKGK